MTLIDTKSALAENITVSAKPHFLAEQSNADSQQYVFSYINYPLSDLVQLSFLNFANLSDYSIAINPQITWEAFQDVSVSFMGNYFIGEADTEFGLQDWGWRIRIRGYF